MAVKEEVHHVRGSEERSEKEKIKPSKRMGMGNEERKKMKSSTNSLEERDIIALESVALVRRPLMSNKIKLIMSTLIKVQYQEMVMPTTKVMWSGVSVAAAVTIAAFFNFHKSYKPPSPDFFITHVYKTNLCVVVNGTKYISVCFSPINVSN